MQLCGPTRVLAEFAWKAVNLSNYQISAGSSLTLPIKGRSVSESAYEAGATLGCQFWGGFGPGVGNNVTFLLYREAFHVWLKDGETFEKPFFIRGE